MSVSGIAAKDFGTIGNDLLYGLSVPAIASIQWSGKSQQFQLRDAVNGFRGEFVETSVTKVFYGGGGS